MNIFTLFNVRKVTEQDKIDSKCEKRPILIYTHEMINSKQYHSIWGSETHKNDNHRCKMNCTVFVKCVDVNTQCKHNAFQLKNMSSSSTCLCRRFLEYKTHKHNHELNLVCWCIDYWKQRLFVQRNTSYQANENAIWKSKTPRKSYPFSVKLNTFPREVPQIVHIILLHLKTTTEKHHQQENLMF